MGAFLLPSLPRNDLFTAELSQSWYLYIQSRNCRNQLAAEAQLHKAQMAGIDTLVYNVHQGGAHYSSKYYPPCPQIEPGFDPLDYLSNRGKELGIHIIAWMCPGKDGYQLNPAWDIAGRYGAPPTMHWMDFSLPEARAVVKDIAVDITSKYPVDICLDYIRYQKWWPGRSLQLSAHDITTTVSMVKDAIAPRKLIADVKAFDYANYLQDWFTWLRTGIIDLVHPMVYASQAGQIPAWVRRWDDDIPMEKIVPLLSLYDFYIDPVTVKKTRELLVEVDECRDLKLDGNGFAFFDSDGLNSKNSPQIRKLVSASRQLLSRIPE